VRIKKTLAGAALATLALTALTACGGSDSDGDNESSSSTETEAPEPADIRVWLNGADTPQEARDWLKTTFEEQNPGSTLTIEEQEWDGLVERLTTALSSESETPDVVEIGNTQAPTFTSAGAFADLTDQLDALGGDDLLQGFVDGATVDGSTYAVPYYAGSKYVFYRTDLFEEAGLEVPTTMDEFVETAVALKEANPDPKNFSGFWFPGQDWRNGAAFVWDAGGDLAVEDGGEWTGALASDESVAGLERAQQLFEQASGAAKDGNEADSWTPFCAGEIGMVSAPGWIKGLIEDPEAGCPEMAKNIGVFALPGAEGGPAPVLLGGSDIAIAAKSQNQELAQAAVALMVSDDYQTILAENGLTPAKNSLAPLLGDDEFAQATIEAASNAKLTPAAPGWALVEGSRVLEDLFSAIAQGGDVADLAADADEQMNAQLNG
jgi:N,N'-diacetylchitobiose transport system substrate-binding protein